MELRTTSRNCGMDMHNLAVVEYHPILLIARRLMFKVLTCTGFVLEFDWIQSKSSRPLLCWVRFPRNFACSGLEYVPTKLLGRQLCLTLCQFCQMQCKFPLINKLACNAQEPVKKHLGSGIEMKKGINPVCGGRKCRISLVSLPVAIKKQSDAMAGNRTQVNCLEGSYAHHYTTIAT